jgi:hypothetical protein
MHDAPEKTLLFSPIAATPRAGVKR